MPLRPEEPAGSASRGRTRLDLGALDARAKLLATLVLMLPLLLDPTPPTVAAYLPLLALGLSGSGAAHRAARGLGPVAWLALGLAVFTALATPEGRIWLGGVVPLSLPGLVQGAILGARMVELVALGLLLAATTPPLRLAAAVEWLLRPLRALGLDVQALSLAVLLALRFVPLLRRELATTEQAMLLRGVRFGRGPVDQVRRLGVLAVPAVGRLLVASEELAAALVSRGYGLAPLAADAHPPLGRAERALLALSVAVAAATLLL